MGVETPTAARPLPPARPALRRARRSLGERLRAAMAALHDHHGQLIETTESPWASITFAGTRITMTWVFLGDAAVAAGERLVAALPDHEFAIPGQIVADAAVTALEHRLLPSPRMVVECALLLLEDS